MAMCVRVLTPFRKATLRAIRLHGLVSLFVAVCVLALAAQAADAAISPRGISRPAGAAQAQQQSTASLGYSLTPSKSEPYAVCPASRKGRMECLSIAVPRRAAVESAEVESLFGHGSAPAVVPNYEGTGKEGGFSPQNLRSAYKLPSTGGSGQTVAIVDAFDDPNAEADLNVYRQEYGLGECTKANGCFKKVNQEGKEDCEHERERQEKAWLMVVLPIAAL
jgi:hypothetical protein